MYFAALSGREATLQFSGGVFNPAVVSGLYAVNGTNSSLWVYWIAPLFASGVAVVMFVLMSPAEFSKDIPRYVLVFLRDWNISKYFTEFICTFFLTISAILGNGGEVWAGQGGVYRGESA